MRKRFSFLSGLAAVILFLFTFSTGALAAETTQSGTGTSGTGTVQDTTYTDVQTTTYSEVPSSSSSDVTDNTYDVTGSTYDVTDATYDVTSSTYDVTGSTYDVTGSTYDVTDSTYDVTDSTYDVTGSTYDVTGSTYQDVYQDVYYDWADVANTTPTDGNAVFDYSNNSNSGLMLDTYLTKDDVAQVSHIVAKIGGVEVSYPVQVLPLDQYLTFSIFQSSKVFANALSPVYDFSIEAYNFETDNTTLIKDFSQNPVLLTFKFDPKLLKNANDDVVVKYIDDKGNISPEAIEIVSVDKVNGVIVAKVKHFSNYGVFEVASTTNTGNTGGTSTTGTTTTTPTTSSTTTATPVSTTPTTSSTATATPVSTTPTTATTSTTSTTGNALPNTATENYNFLMAGFALVALGGILFSIRNRKSIKQGN